MHARAASAAALKSGRKKDMYKSPRSTRPSSYYLLPDTDTGRPKRTLPSHLYNRPIEEVDPFVYDDTFCMIGSKLGRNYVHRFSSTKSVFIFGPLNPIRRIACRIVGNVFFDIIIILTIITNCITLALDTNEEIGISGEFAYDEEKEGVIRNLEYFFIVVYTVEMLVKVVAKGFVLNKFSYLRNVWNLLDFVIIVFGYITIWVHLAERTLDNDLQFFSTLRVLRAIKTVSLIPGLRLMINALMRSVVQLVEVMTLTMVALVIFALMALQLFMGKLRHKCVLIMNSEMHEKMVKEELSRNPDELLGGPIQPGDPDAKKLWYEWVHRQDNWLMRNYPFYEPVPCSNESLVGNGRLCPKGYVCLENIGGNYDHGWTSFDNFFSSMLTTFQLLSTDFWERPYDLIMSTTNPWSVIFCIIVIFLGFFYLLNLMLAVVAMSYEKEVKKKSEVPLTKQQKLSVHRKASTFSFNDPARLKVTVMTCYRKRTPSERALIARTFKADAMKEEAQELDALALQPGNVQKRPNLHNAIMTLLGRRVSMEAEPVRKGSTDGSANRSGSQSPSLGSVSSVMTGMEIVPQIHSEISPMHTPPKYGRDREEPKLLSIDSNHSQEHSDASTVTKSAKLAKSLHLNAKHCCSKCLLSLRANLTPIATSPKFELVITGIILMNTLLLASEHHEQPDWLEKMVADTRGFVNLFFTAVFTLEAAIKICALQKEYFTSPWNVFDFAIVVQSILDLALYDYKLFSKMFKPMRLLRIFKLANSWITMKVLLNIIFATFGALGNLTLVLIIVLYMFAILGLKVIGEYYTKVAFGAEDDDDIFPRWNWQDFSYAFMLVFRVICGEWIEPLWECLEATAEYKEEYKCFFIFVPIFVIGNLIVLNLFLALLLNSFDTEDLNARRKKELEAVGRADRLKKYVGRLLEKKTPADSDSERNSAIRSREPSYNLSSFQPQNPRDRFKSRAKQIIVLNRKKVAERMIHQLELSRKQTFSARRLSNANSLLAQSYRFSRGQLTDFLQVGGSRRKAESCIPKKCWMLNCCLFRCLRRGRWGQWDSMRSFALVIVSHPGFEWLILGLIFASSITLCFEDVYLESRPNLKEALFYISITFTCIFIAEMILKWFALGLWNYFTAWWTILDFFIVMVSLISWYHDFVSKGYPASPGLASLKALRTLRALRPLRAISRWQGMKIVVNALMFAIPSIINVLLVCLLFWLIFSIMGVQFFKGMFYKCVDNDTGNKVPNELVQTREQCCAHTERWSWINQHPNFDNVFLGYLTLFQVATFEGWMEAMQASADATGVNMQPKRDNNFIAYLFYVVFIVFGSFFILNLFIGVIIDNFNRLKKKYEGNLVEALLTPNQLHYYTAMKKLGRKKPRKVIQRPQSFFVGIFYDIAMSRRFEIIIFVMIFINIFIMAFESYNQRKVYKHILDGFNALFTTIFALEAMAKIIGLRHYYFVVVWNVFDFILVVLSIVDIVLGDTSEDLIPIPPTFLRVIRIFRVGRVLRLIKAATGIRRLLFALIVSLPALFNIGCLLFLITFIYAILGMSLFGGNAYSNTIDSVFNFDTFLRSCLILLRLMTAAAGWNDVLSAMTVIEPHCGNYRNIKCGRGGEGKCPVHSFAIVYIVSYIFISSLIVINMYVAIILENFYEANKEDEVGIVEDDLEMFYIRWARYDPEATQFIQFEHLSEFLASLDPPLGIPMPNIVAIVAFNLPIARGNKIHCLDILHALIKHVLGHIDDTEEFRKLQEQMEHKFRKQFPTRKLLNIVSSTRVWKIQHNAAVTIQRAWRAYRTRKHPQRHSNSTRPNTTVTYTMKEKEKNPKMKKKLDNLLHLGQSK